jgi:hypothetical protein
MKPQTHELTQTNERYFPHPKLGNLNKLSIEGALGFFEKLSWSCSSNAAPLFKNYFVVQCPSKTSSKQYYVSELETSNFSQDQGEQGIVRRHTLSMSHKQSRSSTQRLRKRAVSRTICGIFPRAVW